MNLKLTSIFSGSIFQIKKASELVYLFVLAAWGTITYSLCYNLWEMY